MPARDKSSPTEPDEKPYTAKDVREHAGLSYRQLNHWENEGVLPTSDEPRQRKWRKFSVKELFALMVCAELRKRHGASNDDLRWIQSFMLQKDADHFRAAVEMIAYTGLSVFLLTDCKETFVMDHELEFADLWENGYFGGEHPQSFVLMKLNPLVNELASELERPFQLKHHWRFKDMMVSMRKAMTAQNQEETHLLRLVRDPAYKEVRVALQDGEISQFWANEPIELADLSVDDLLEAEQFQTLRLNKKHGKVVSAERTIPIKPEKMKTLTRNEADELLDTGKP